MGAAAAQTGWRHGRATGRSGWSRTKEQHGYRLGRATRNLRSHGLKEGASTRLLIYAGKLAVAGLSVDEACRATLVESLTDDAEMIKALESLLQSVGG